MECAPVLSGDGRHWHCCSCGFAGPLPSHRNLSAIHRRCGKSQRRKPVEIGEPVCMAGCQLSRLLAAIGIKHQPDCDCENHAIEMDRSGIEWCEQNIPTITGWMREEAERRGMKFYDLPAKLLVKRAIRLAKKELAAAHSLHRTGD